MAPLDSRARASLPDSAFAYVDSKGRRRLPINDAPHVRNALARFEQTAFEGSDARERSRQRLLKAARKFGISPIGFFDVQLRKERRQAEEEGKAARFARLPRGVVTFVLADVEGSTRLAGRLGDNWPELLARVWRQLRTVVERSGGYEVDVRGDEYLAVFGRPADALTTAIRIQRALSIAVPDDRLPIRVRIGLHTGRPSISDAAYAGIVMHTVARVCSAGHGGQILLSAATQQAMADTRVAGASVRSLGRYVLAGLARPEVLFQVDAEGLEASFPRLRARLAPSRTRLIH